MKDCSKFESVETNQLAIDSIARRELLSRMSHELRTPMAVIMGFADIIHEQTVSPDIKEYALVIRRHGEKLLERLNGILSESEATIGNPRSVTLFNAEAMAMSADVQKVAMPHIEAKVLLADDMRDVRSVARHILKRSGCQVTSVENGRQAVDAIQAAILRNVPFDLAIFDVQMPEMTGLEAVAELRASSIDIPVIALTADVMKGTREQLLRAGFTEYLSKPIVASALRFTVGRLLEE